MNDTNQKEPELKKITQEELSIFLVKHSNWLENRISESTELFNFKSMDFRGCKFNKTDLQYIDFSGSNLSEIYFWDVDLSCSNFSNTILTDVMFCRKYENSKDIFSNSSTLTNCSFQNAAMCGADLRGTKTAGMLLGGADVTNAILPDEIKSFDGLKTVEEASKICKRLFTMLLTSLGFSALTILSTQDHLLLTNSPTTPLPIIQTTMQLASFYKIAPFLLSALYLYFLFNLLHLYKLISRLPAVFPDGIPLDEKIYPWLLNTLVREFFPNLSKEKPPFFWARKLFVVFLAWWSTLIVLFFFWLRYLSRHDPWWSGLHIVWIGLVIFTIIFTYSTTLRILKNKPDHIWWWKYLLAFLGLYFLICTIDITALAHFGNPTKPLMWEIPAHFGSFNKPSVWEIPLKQWLSANFEDQEVSHKPENWSPEKPIEGVKGARLEHANLDYVHAKSAFLVNAKMKGASLKNADLTQTNLIRADLSEANLEGANLAQADLAGTKLFNTSNLTPQQVKKANHWQLAVYDKTFKESNEMGLSDKIIHDSLCKYLNELKPNMSKDESNKLFENDFSLYKKQYGMTMVGSCEKQEKTLSKPSVPQGAGVKQ